MLHVSLGLLNPRLMLMMKICANSFCYLLRIDRIWISWLGKMSTVIIIGVHNVILVLICGVEGQVADSLVVLQILEVCLAWHPWLVKDPFRRKTSLFRSFINYRVLLACRLLVHPHMLISIVGALLVRGCQQRLWMNICRIRVGSISLYCRLISRVLRRTDILSILRCEIVIGRCRSKMMKLIGWMIILVCGVTFSIETGRETPNRAGIVNAPFPYSCTSSSCKTFATNSWTDALWLTLLHPHSSTRQISLPISTIVTRITTWNHSLLAINVITMLVGHATCTSYHLNCGSQQIVRRIS